MRNTTTLLAMVCMILCSCTSVGQESSTKAPFTPSHPRPRRPDSDSLTEKRKSGFPALQWKLLDESKSAVPHRNGGKTRGSHIYKDFRDAFKGGKVTIAVKSFLRYGINRGGPSPQGHLTVWLEEQKIPSMLK